MTYSLPVKNGKHTLILKFAEVKVTFKKDVFLKEWPKSIQHKNWK